MSLEHSAAEVLAGVMLALELGTDPLAEIPADWPIHLSALPPEDNRAIAVYDTEPVKEGRIISSGEGIRRWGCQIVTRAGKNEYSLGWSRMMQIVDALEAVGAKSVAFDDGTYIIKEVDVESGPMFFGREPENERPKFSTNVLVLIAKV